MPISVFAVAKYLATPAFTSCITKLPAPPPLPVPKNLLFQFSSGKPTTILMSEFFVGFKVAYTSQRAGISFIAMPSKESGDFVASRNLISVISPFSISSLFKWLRYLFFTSSLVILTPFAPSFRRIFHFLTKICFIINNKSVCRNQSAAFFTESRFTFLQSYPCKNNSFIFISFFVNSSSVIRFFDCK